MELNQSNKNRDRNELKLTEATAEELIKELYSYRHIDEVGEAFKKSGLKDLVKHIN